jgi:FkbM family methyltransferase
LINDDSRNCAANAQKRFQALAEVKTMSAWTQAFLLSIRVEQVIEKLMKIAQLLMEKLLRQPSGSFRFRALRKLRQLLIRVHDPLVQYELAGTVIQLPFSHDLPLYRKLYPAYSTNIARITQSIQAKYPGSACIDIGANVGDTAVLVRSASACPILCIEGEAFFFQLLQQNTTSVDNVVCDNSFVGESSGFIQGNLVSERGTAHLVMSVKGQTQTSARSLSDILADHPVFAAAKLVKVDTDGFDIRILQANLDFFQSVHPTIFFEYDPHSFGLVASSGISVFSDLRMVGYHDVMVYDNSGDYLLTTTLLDMNILEDLHYYYSGRQGLAYCDLCVFPLDDADICRSLRQSELHFFASMRHVTMRQ